MLVEILAQDGRSKAVDTQGALNVLNLALTPCRKTVPFCSDAMIIGK